MPHKDSGFRCLIAHGGPKEILPPCIQCAVCHKYIRPEDMDGDCTGPPPPRSDVPIENYEVSDTIYAANASKTPFCRVPQHLDTVILERLLGPRTWNEPQVWCDTEYRGTTPGEPKGDRRAP